MGALLDILISAISAGAVALLFSFFERHTHLKKKLLNKLGRWAFPLYITIAVLYVAFRVAFLDKAFFDNPIFFGVVFGIFICAHPNFAIVQD